MAMSTSSNRKRTTTTTPKRTASTYNILKYLFASLLLIAIMTVLKGAIAWLAERFVYTLPLLGGLLKSLEIVEVSNVIVFALLGVGLGAFTLWLPRRWLWYPKAIALVIGVPIVFLSGYVVRHQVWVQQVAVESELLPTQATEVTNRLLQEATGNEGAWGFFNYTVKVPIVPTDLSVLKNVNQDDKWFRSELTRYSGVEPGIFARLFRWTGWGIRLFYTVLVVVTATIYFTKGLVWASANRKPSN